MKIKREKDKKTGRQKKERYKLKEGFGKRSTVEERSSYILYVYYKRV